MVVGIKVRKKSVTDLIKVYVLQVRAVAMIADVLSVVSLDTESIYVTEKQPIIREKGKTLVEITEMSGQAIRATRLKQTSKC